MVAADLQGVCAGHRMTGAVHPRGGTRHGNDNAVAHEILAERLRDLLRKFLASRPKDIRQFRHLHGHATERTLPG
ncbi:MAG: hypothetical protein P8Z80_08900 [Pseudolabrys sp.]